MIRVSDAHGRDHRHRSRADAVYLDALANRLSQVCDLPLATARRRVLQMAISAKPRGEGYRRDGQDRFL